ncbi:MAG: hypothetical protein RX316_05005 [bacterium]|nr:hypothetical protein [bacterium]
MPVRPLAIGLALAAAALAAQPAFGRWRENTLTLKTPTSSAPQTVRSRLYVLPGEVVEVSVRGRAARFPGDGPADFRGQPLHCGTNRAQPTLCNLTLYCFVAGRTDGPDGEVIARKDRYMSYHHPMVRREPDGFAWTAQDAGFVHCGIHAVHVGEQSQGGFTVHITIAEGAPAP